MNDFIVRLVPLPSSIEGFTLPDENGDYNIYLNEALEDDKRRKAFDHELEHIYQGHFEDDVKSVAEKEEEVHKKEEPRFRRA